MTAGQGYCMSNVPGECKPNPRTKKHVCHAIIEAPYERGEIPGVFYIDEENPRVTTFMSDARRRANGM
jgi:hypothetical protein